MQNLSDRALKERIIGAVVLVFVAVLVVPIFLDGPPDDRETISTSVTLPGQSGEDRQQQTIVLNRDRSEPVPATRADSTPAAKSPPVAATQSLPEPDVKVAQEKPVIEKSESKPTSVDVQATVPVEEETSAGGYDIGNGHVGRAAGQLLESAECREARCKSEGPGLCGFPEPA